MSNFRETLKRMTADVKAGKKRIFDNEEETPMETQEKLYVVCRENRYGDRKDKPTWNLTDDAIFKTLEEAQTKAEKVAICYEPDKVFVLQAIWSTKLKDTARVFETEAYGNDTAE